MTARAIVHVDMDAFYASVEQRDDPSLRGRPLIVGGHPTRGVVLAASYEVRQFGVHSAMPMSRAVKLAPTAIVVPPRPRAYAEASEHVFTIFGSVTPLVEPLSLDEAFMDVGGSIGLFGPPTEIARMIRRRIAQELHLPASAGIAATKFVAKVASDLAKPNGQVEVPPAETVAFLARLPVKRLWGAGPKTQARLQELGLMTMGDVAASDPAWLERRLGSVGRHFWELSQGIDPREVTPDREAKSIGAEDTFAEDLRGEDALRPQIHAQALRVGKRLRSAGVMTRVVQLKLKLADFTTLTRRATLPEPTDDGQTLFRASMELFARSHGGRSIRLTGVSAQDLLSGTHQLSLFDEGPRKAAKLNATLDRITERFGPKAILTADLAGTDTGHDDEARRRMGSAQMDQRDGGEKKPPRG